MSDASPAAADPGRPANRRWRDPGRWIDPFLWLHGALALFSAAAFFLVVGRPAPGWIDPGLWNLAYFHGMQWSGAAFIAAGFVAAALAWRDAVPGRRGLIALAAVLVISLAAELIGTTTGLPFGPYSYGTRLGPVLFGHVPAVIPLSWFLMLYASLGIAARLGLSAAGTAVAAALGLVAWDVLMDPAMSAAFPFWSWHVEGSFYGMPLLNWAGWLLTGLVLAAVTVPLVRHHLTVLASQRTPSVLYALNAVLPLALAVESELWGAVAAGGGAMALYLAAPALVARRRLVPGLERRGGRFRRWLRRLVRRETFRRRAAAFPLTRPAVLRSSERLFRWATGFAATQTARALLETGALDRLCRASSTAAEVAGATGLTEDAALRLLRAGQSLDLVARRNGVWEPTVDGEALAAHDPLRAMIRHHGLLYRDLEDPAELLRRQGRDSELRRLWSYGGDADRGRLDEEDVAAYGRLMTRTARMTAEAVLHGYDLSRHGRLLDVAGGEGAFLARVAEAHPDLELGLFELPPVARRARGHLREQGLLERVEVTDGDVFRDPLPGGADLITLQRVLLDWPDEQAAAILRRVREALVPGGRVLAAEPVLDSPGMPPEAGPYFEMYFLAMGGGRARDRSDLVRLFHAAGLRRVRFPASPVPAEATLVVAEA